ncbi:hypothetical protein M422DRAFT_265037 [Sphaerobolus stellatus SS14]|uniref:Uncharacterized protein n=1 Tax=Sphaerobolus stellatus (strain SS14) TaxID=990650 RepID=A0A0C9UUS5_SPHS4|nr:hypothetical protein M422DRAFT_265037 [Sphaerobolus stellatus SS14]
MTLSKLHNHPNDPAHYYSHLLPSEKQQHLLSLLKDPSTPPQSNDTNGANGAKKLPDQQNVPPMKGPVGLNPLYWWFPRSKTNFHWVSTYFCIIKDTSYTQRWYMDLPHQHSIEKTRMTKDHSDAFHFSVISTVKLNLFGGDSIGNNPGVKYANAKVSAAFKKLSKAELNVYSERQCQLLEKKKTTVNPESMVEDGMQENMSNTEV